MGITIDFQLSKPINAINKEDEVNINNMGKSKRDFIFIDDTIRSIMDIINGGIYNGPINIASGESISIETAINELKEKLKTEIRYK